MKRIIIIILFWGVNLFAQAYSADSLKSLVRKDTVLTNSIVSKFDSTKKKSFDVDDIIYSSAEDSLTFDLNNKKMYIYGTGELKYKNTVLKGGKIDVNFETSDLAAEGTFQTEDSLKNKIAQTPVLTEGDETYEGNKLKYNFKTKKGFISAAKNKKGEARYEGKAVKKVDENTYFIKEGIYTTCEGDTPSTYFSAKQMKVMQKDKIIAKWIFMHIGGVPLPLPIPFAVFPNEKGRRSGIITPSYGTTRNRGSYFRNFGYYFALSDYTDLALTGDYYTRGGYRVRSRFRYNKKYNFSGSFNANYSNITIGEDNDPDKSVQTDWSVAFNHNQVFTPTLRLDANLQFQTGGFIKNNSVSYNNLLKTDITSNATLSKRWDESGNSLTLSYSRVQNLQTGNVTEVLPSISFSKSQTYPFKRKNSSARDQRWYEYIGYNYRGEFRNTRRKIDDNLSIHGGIQHNISVGATPKIGYFNISPRLSYVEKWYNKKTQRYVEQISDVQSLNSFRQTINNIAAHDTVLEREVHDINMIRTFDFSLSTSTKLYGMMQPRILGIEAIRHTVTPSVSYNYRPDYSKSSWGYYDSIEKSDGTYERYDPYSGEVFGGVSRGESQSINFSLGNRFEMKTMEDPTDTTSKSEKINLLNLDFSGGYNFAADSLRLSDLSVRFRTKIADILSFSGSSAYTFYDFNDNKRKINKYLASEGKGLFRLTNLRFSISASISGDKLKGKEKKKENTSERTGILQGRERNYTNLYADEDDEADFSIPWNLNLTYNFNLAKPTPAKGIINSNIGVSLGFNLAKKWKFGIRGNYDFQREEISAPQVTIHRDLNCWEMNFSWKPIGIYRGYRFEIRMKAPELRDIKVTKTSGLYTGR